MTSFFCILQTTVSNHGGNRGNRGQKTDPISGRSQKNHAPGQKIGPISGRSQKNHTPSQEIGPISGRHRHKAGGASLSGELAQLALSSWPAYLPAAVLRSPTGPEP